MITFLQNNTKQKQESRMKIPLQKKKVSTLDDKTRLESVVLWVYISLYEHCEESGVSQLLKRLSGCLSKEQIFLQGHVIYIHMYWRSGASNC